MLPITNPKVESLEPKWARFAGWSLLFDNPGDSLRGDGRSETIDCRVDLSPELGLYRELSQAAFDFQGAPNECGMCLLPPSSYHVTFFDCGNQANAEGARPNCNAALGQLIEGLPNSWSEEHELVLPSAKNSVAISPFPNITFRYSHLINWGYQVIAAAVQPADEISKANLEWLIAEREKLSNHYRTTYGFGAGPKYTPHVSLAYFANDAGGEKASGKTEEWDQILRERTQGLEVHFNSVSAYAFTDMATFFRERQGLRPHQAE